MSRKETGKKCAQKFNVTPYEKVWGKIIVLFYLFLTLSIMSIFLQFKKLNKCHLMEP